MSLLNQPDPFDPQVAIYRAGSSTYLQQAPFHPEAAYPEYAFGAEHVSPLENVGYRAVREALRLLGLDRERYGTPAWNPLAGIVRPGDRVVVKPNYVQHVNYSEQDYDSVVVHTSLVRAAIDYALIALRGEGRVTIADAPLWDAEFETIVARMRVRELLAFYARQGVDVELVDMRRMRVVQKHGLVVERSFRADEGARSRVLDLGDASELVPLEPWAERLNGMDYDRLETVRHHSGGRHEYCVSQRILDADVVINMPKLKTHKKSGVTLAMKNLVGINVDKNFLPHYRIGTPREGGDELPDLTRPRHKLAHRLLRRGIDSLLMRREARAVPLLLPLFGGFGALNRLTRRDRREAGLPATHPGYNQLVINSVYRALLGSEVRAGNWEGNDTIWRMILDLNKCLLYFDRAGRLHDTPQRRAITILDGVVAGERDGPMNPAPVYAGVVLVGLNPFHVDQAAAQVMGLDERALKVLTNVPRIRRLPLARAAAPRLRSNHPAWSGARIRYEDSLRFEPHPAWPSLRGKREGAP